MGQSVTEAGLDEGPDGGRPGRGTEAGRDEGRRRRDGGGDGGGGTEAGRDEGRCGQEREMEAVRDKGYGGWQKKKMLPLNKVPK